MRRSKEAETQAREAKMLDDLLNLLPQLTPLGQPVDRLVIDVQAPCLVPDGHGLDRYVCHNGVPSVVDKYIKE